MPDTLIDPTVLEAIAEQRINTSLLLRTLAQIESAPDLWKQEVWRDVSTERCQTPMCFAGWSATLAGGGTWARTPREGFYLGGSEMLEYDERIDRGGFVGSIRRATQAGDEVIYDYDAPTIPTVTAETRALRVLGLNHAQGRKLFSGENTLADIRRVVVGLCQDQWWKDAEAAGYSADDGYSDDELSWGPPREREPDDEEDAPA